MTDPRTTDDLAELGEDELEEAQEEPIDDQPQPRAKRAGAPRPSEVRSRVGGEDELPYVDDRVSKLWVALIVAVFGAILVYGLLFGKAGMLTPATPSPTPRPSASPTAVPTASPVATPTHSPSPTATPTASPTATPTASPTPSATNAASPT